MKKQHSTLSGAKIKKKNEKKRLNCPFKRYDVEVDDDEDDERYSFSLLT